MKKKKIFALLLTVSMLLTAGCSKKIKDIKTVDETQTDAEQLNETQDDLAQFRDAKVWNDDLQGTYKGEKVDISFFAQIEIPACTQSVVVEGKFLEFDEEYKKIVLEKVADGEDIYYYDIAHLTTEEYEVELEMLEEMYKYYDRFTHGIREEWDEGWDEAWYRSDKYYTMTKEEIKERIEAVKKYLATSGNEYIKATDFNVDEYRIKRNGGWCEINFLRQDTGSQTIFMKGERDNGPDGIWKNAAGVFTDPLSRDAEENVCKFSQKEAGQEAVSFARKIGFDGLVPMEARHLLVSPYYEGEEDGPDDDLIYGYKITLGTGINGEPMFGTMNEEGLAGKAKVMDDGVFSFYVNNPYEQTRVSEHVALLSLDKIKAAFKKELAQNLDFYCMDNRKKFKFDTLKLLYLWQMKDAATGEGAYIPVWVLKDTSMEPEVNVYVNAIDGTVLNTEDLR